MLPFIIAGIASVAAAAIGAGAAAHNTNSQKEMNEQNISAQEKMNEQQMEMYQQQLDWSKHQQHVTWQREDTALQRMVEDSQAAGLSPLAGVSGHNSGTVVSQPSLPNMSAPQGIAPQFDASGIQAGLMETANLAYLYDKMNSDVNMQKAQMDLEREKLSAQLSMHDDQLSQDLSKLLSTQNHEKEMLELEKIVQQNATILSAHNGNVKLYYETNKYNAAIQEWAEGYQDIVNEFTSQSQSQSQNTSGGLNAFGTGGNLGTGSSESSSVQNSANLQAALEGYCKVNPFPVIVGKDGAWKSESDFYNFLFKSAKLQKSSKKSEEKSSADYEKTVTETGATSGVPGKQYSYNFSDRY